MFVITTDAAILVVRKGMRYRSLLRYIADLIYKLTIYKYMRLETLR